MARLLDGPLTPKVGKSEEFVEKQLADARKRIRLLDFWSVGLTVATMAFFVAAGYLWLERSWELPPRSLLALVVGFVLFAGAYAYRAVLRPSRRGINPYYVARHLELEAENAKNSVVSWVDLHDDTSIPASVRTALGAKAAKDLKHVDPAEAFRDRQLAWLAGAFAVATISAVFVAFLPPTRTTITLTYPANGDLSVLVGEDVRIEVTLAGRVPAVGAPDAARLRLFTRPEEPTAFEERPLEMQQSDRRLWATVIPARQVERTRGFRYQVLAGNAVTPEYRVVCRILPAFVGFDVKLNPPSYVAKKPETSTDPNLVGNYGTEVILTAKTNRPVQAGVLDMEGSVRPVNGVPVEGDPEALRFRFKLDRSTKYRIRFTTAEGEKNPDPPAYRITLVDPVPQFTRLEVDYRYPEYLGWKNETLTPKEWTVEAMRGTQVRLRLTSNRPVRRATLETDGKPPIVGETTAEEPLTTTFPLPDLTKDATYRVTLQPNTDEKPATPRTLTVRVLSDEAPTVRIVQPLAEEVTVAANGQLPLEGSATDDYGLTKVTLRAEVIAPARTPLAPKPYRAGKSFRRDADGTYPQELAYKDVIDVAQLKPVGEAGFVVREGMVIEYWLEAEDNCTVPPGPNVGVSPKKRFKVGPAVQAPEARKQEADAKQKQQQHEKAEDQRNAEEKRDNKQPQRQPEAGEPKQNEPKDGKAEPKDGKGEPKQGDPGAKGEPKQGDPGAKGEPKQGDPGAKGEPNKGEDNALNEQERQVNEALGKKDAEPGPMPRAKDGPPQMPEEGPMPEPKDGNAADRAKELADKLDSPKPEERAEARKRLERQMERERKEHPEDAKAKEQQAQKERDNLNPDDKEKFDKANDRIQQEKQQMRQEKADADPKKKEMRDAAKQLQSDDPKEREEGKKKVEDMMRKNPEAKQELEQEFNDAKKELEHEEGAKKQNLDNAIKDAADRLSREKPKTGDGTGQPQPPQPKKEETDELAKKSQDKDEKKAQAAKDELEKKLRDPATREQTKKQLDDFKKNAPDEQKKEIEQIEKNAEAKGDQPQPKDGKPSKEQMQQAAKQLQSDDPKEREAGKKNVEDMMRKNPEAKQELEQEFNKAKQELENEEGAKKENLDNAIKDAADRLSREQPKGKDGGTGTPPPPKPKQDDVDELGRKKPKAKESETAKGTDAPKDGKQENKSDTAKGKDGKQENKSDTAKGTDTPKDGKQEKNSDTAKGTDTPKDGKQEKNSDTAKGAGTAKDGKPEKNGDTAKADAQQEKIDAAVDQAKQGDAQAKEEAAKKLEEQLKDPATREETKEKINEAKDKLADAQQRKNVDEALKKAEEKLAAAEGKKDGEPKKATAEAKKGTGDKLNADNRTQSGTGNTKPAEPGSPADLKNKLKSGDLLLEKFKREITNEEFKKNLKWSDADVERFMRNKERQLDEMRQQLEAAEQGDRRGVGPSPLNRVETVPVAPKEGGVDPLRSGKYIAPPGFGDAYKKFTEDISGVKRP